MDHRELFAIRGCLEFRKVMTSTLGGMQNFRASGREINTADFIRFSCDHIGLAVVRKSLIWRCGKAADIERTRGQLNMTVCADIRNIEMLIAYNGHCVTGKHLATEQKAGFVGVKCGDWNCVHVRVR
jgi:hypothetical protein